MGKPVLVLRRETERPEAITAGTVRLAGTEEAEVYRLGSLLLEDQAVYAQMAHAVNPYGDGQAGASLTPLSGNSACGKRRRRSSGPDLQLGQEGAGWNEKTNWCSSCSSSW